MTARIATQHLPKGGLVYTTGIDGTDFNIPLVAPIYTLRGRHIRTVRNHLHCQGGHVVWFTDGTKTRPLHGKTRWLLAEPFLGDPREEESA